MSEPTEREWLEGLDPRTEQDRRDEAMSEHTPLTKAEWSDILATLPESPETALGWELSLVRRTVERILAARTSTATADTDQDRERLTNGLIKQHRVDGAATPEATADADELADWLGAMPESRNVFDITDEATTVISIDVETLAQRIATRATADTGLRERVLLEAADALDAESERVGGMLAGDCTDWLRTYATAAPTTDTGARDE